MYIKLGITVNGCDKYFFKTRLLEIVQDFTRVSNKLSFYNTFQTHTMLCCAEYRV